MTCNNFIKTKKIAIGKKVNNEVFNYKLNTNNVFVTTLNIKNINHYFNDLKQQFRSFSKEVRIYKLNDNIIIKNNDIIIIFNLYEKNDLFYDLKNHKINNEVNNNDSEIFINIISNKPINNIGRYCLKLRLKIKEILNNSDMFYDFTYNEIKLLKHIKKEKNINKSLNNKDLINIILSNLNKISYLNYGLYNLNNKFNKDLTFVNEVINITNEVYDYNINDKDIIKNINLCIDLLKNYTYLINEETTLNHNFKTYFVSAYDLKYGVQPKSAIIYKLNILKKLNMLIENLEQLKDKYY